MYWIFVDEIRLDSFASTVNFEREKKKTFSSEKNQKQNLLPSLRFESGTIHHAHLITLLIVYLQLFARYKLLQEQEQWHQSQISSHSFQDVKK